MLIACAALLGLGSNAAYTLKPIFTDPSQTVECFGLNDMSQVICDVTDPSDRTVPQRAFLWKDGKLTEIVAHKEDPDDIVSVSGFEVNNDGTVVGAVYVTSLNGEKSGWNFRWNDTSGMEKLIVNGHLFAASSINNQGDIEGIVPNSENPFGPMTFGVLTSNKGFIPYLLTNDPSFGGPLNDKGAIAGVTHERETPLAFRILPGSLHVEPLMLPVHEDPKAGGGVTAINNNGWIVGSVTLHPDAYLQKDRMAMAALWSPDNKFHTFGDAAISYVALDINDNAEVVGATRVVRGNHDTRAFIYDTKNGVRILDNLVPPGSPHLLRADAINNKGEILCESPSGWFLLTPNGVKPRSDGRSSSGG